ncbi:MULTISPECIES: serine/threonine-protein kinase [Cyanophyceae]|uniref:Serine/threonine-protein kinase n=1 Tax=Leptolyngbya subtilissima DQ-A4 TaxID=2933933 RepID=A0ABV0KAV1_9CYAN|nr:serine/threonine-protein kinase [Nodosilinea sp. FACHB-141]MBD2115184.1 pentapeptide repeat-containing protein [Nodosilinea sp. FACHB-141]
MTSSTKVTLEDKFPPSKFRLEELSRNREGGRITYKATDIALKNAFVLKQFRFANSSDWSGWEFHQREIRALMKLNHPAIPKLLETHETDDGFLLVQEYVNATSLAAQMRHRVFTQAEVRAITTSLLLILQYVHEKGHLCHGDIQPGNVLVDLSSGISVYLIDFGLARSSGDSVAVTTALGGTPGFTAPDQVLNRQAEAHGDIYGIAVIAICLLTGKDPGDIASLRDPRTFRYSYRESLKGSAAAAPPEYFLKWIDKCVSPNSADRYQSARVAHEALKVSEQRHQKARTFRWWLAPPLGLLLGTIIVGGFWRYQTRTIDKHMAELAELEAQSKAQLSAAEERAEQRRQEELKRQEEERKRREEEAAQAILDQRQWNVEQLVQTRSCNGCDLREVDLSRLDLEGVDLRNADLSRAKLESVRLVGANLAGAVLTEANLSDSNISNANFSGAYMEGAQLQRVNGSEAVFQGAVLTHTNFGSGILPGSTFVSADLSNADLGNAEFEGANFEMANLDGTFTFFTSFRDARMPNGFER